MTIHCQIDLLSSKSFPKSDQYMAVKVRFFFLSSSSPTSLLSSMEALKSTAIPIFRSYPVSFSTKSLKPINVSIKPPPSDFDFRSEISRDSRAAIAEAHPELLDLADDGTLVLVDKTRFGPVPAWRAEFVEPQAIWLVGTSHISPKSVKDVERVVRAVKPDNVVVELCRSRAGIMYTLDTGEPDQKLKSNMFSLSGDGFLGAVGRSINLGGQTALALRLLLAVFSSKISSDVNRPFGDEFRAARKASEEVGAQIVLGDRPIEITLERAWNALTWTEKLSLVSSVVRGITSESDFSQNNDEESGRSGSSLQLYEKLSFSFPSLLQPLIHERDTLHSQYLAWSLKRSKAVNESKRVVGVIGRGHMNGVIYALISDQGNLRFRDLAVVTLRNPIEALDTLRARKGFFDLVVTDLHMPQMNGLQLQKKVMQEFKLPVIMMSADEKPSVILKSLEEGVAFYMVKPISLDDVKHVWQYAISPKNVIPNQTITITQRQLSIENSSSSSALCLKKEIIKSKSTKFKNKKAKQKSIPLRKPKVIWTNSLHNRFLQAIRLIGLHKAVPKKILEFMNVPGLTRENVASHLQKYRIFLKRVTEKGDHSMKISADYTLLRSSFANSSHFQFQSPLFTSKFQSQHSYFLQNKQLMPPLNNQCPPNNLLNLTSLSNPNLEEPSMGKSSSLLTLNKSNFPCNGFVVSSSAQDDQNFVSIENENLNCSSNGTGRTTTTGEVQMICLGQNGLCNNIVQAPHDLNDRGLSLDNNGGKHQNLPMNSNKNVEENGPILVSSEEEEGKAANDTIAFGDIDENQNCFDVLSEIFMGHNQNQTSLRKEETDVSDTWNGIEMDASAKQDVQPSRLSAQGWDDDILEMLFGDGSSSS